MGDRTQLNLSADFTDWPQSARDAIVATEAGEPDFHSNDEPFTERDTVIWEEVYCGTVDQGEVQTAILEAFKTAGVDFPFTLWEEPKYEWLGSVFKHRPGQPDFMAECDANGQAQVAESTVRELLKLDDNELRSSLATAIGEQVAA